MQHHATTPHCHVVSNPAFPVLSNRPLRTNIVAKYLGVKEREVRHLAQAGKLRGYKEPGKKPWCFHRSDIEFESLRRRKQADVWVVRHGYFRKED